MFLACSNWRMPEVRRFPPPWTIAGNDACFWVEDAEGKRFAYTYFASDSTGSSTGNRDKLSRNEAWRIVRGVTKLPELLGRGQGDGESGST